MLGLVVPKAETVHCPPIVVPLFGRPWIATAEWMWIRCHRLGTQGLAMGQCWDECRRTRGGARANNCAAKGRVLVPAFISGGHAIVLSVVFMDARQRARTSTNCGTGGVKVLALPSSWCGGTASGKKLLLCCTEYIRCRDNKARPLLSPPGNSGC